MKVSKQQLKMIIKEELTEVFNEGAPWAKIKGVLKQPLNEISPKTQFDPGGFKGIIEMADRAAYALDNLETKFQDDPPNELYVIQRFIESMKKAALWQMGASEAATALYVPSERDAWRHPEERERKKQDYLKQLRRMHTPGYKRDEK